MTEEIVKAEQDKGEFKKVQLQQELGEQIRDRAAKREAERAERKEFVMTTGGPTMEAEDLDALNQRYKN